ncbi:PTS sugar transporter subunit IIB [Alkalibacterium olivapovliticus]|uniref:PTS system cellobiose-specific IIB component n=1 Tax=Alkalibacterium olivapovliticus TaxID=99907 RepID=A0A2T0W7S1_9LACT|nr:PTS sugar transporter subunit IIB [Alkalibacterium olivapovliticus]PRY82745.1 PTS system cellobiose-specific IIB component [Alkalibacterium olivapovliticus]
MASKGIMLVCAAGMSTSMLVSKMQKCAEEKGINADIFAVSADEALTKLETRPVDIILLGPQVRYMKGKFEAKAAEHDIAIDVINMQDYGMMNGENVLESAMALIN